jgi:hypothetical protein
VTKFQRRTLIWFVHRIGEMVNVERVPASKSTALPLVSPMMVVDEKHAKGLHDYHRYNYINFNEYKKANEKPIKKRSA